MGVNGIRYMVSLSIEKVNDMCVLHGIAFRRAGGRRCFLCWGSLFAFGTINEKSGLDCYRGRSGLFAIGSVSKSNGRGVNRRTGSFSCSSS